MNEPREYELVGSPNPRAVWKFLPMVKFQERAGWHCRTNQHIQGLVPLTLGAMREKTPKTRKSDGLVVRGRDHRSWPTFEHFAEQVVVEQERINYRAQADGRNVEDAVRLRSFRLRVE